MLTSQQMKRAAALALASAAIAPTTASASQTEANPAGLAPSPLPTSVVRVTVPSGGFDWGDAGIGAAAGLAMSMFGVGAALTVTQRRTSRSNAATRPTT